MLQRVVALHRDDFDPEEPRFDSFVYVRFEHDFTVLEAWTLPWKALRDHAQPHGMGWWLPLTGPWRGDPRVARLALGA